MKYIILIVVIFLLPACSNQYEQEDYNYIPNNSIRFIRSSNETSLLINKDETYYLLLLGEPNIDIEVDYLVKYKNIETNIESDEEYLLEENLTIDNIEFKLNNKIELNINNINICIYVKELDRDDYSNCNFIYLYNPDNNFYITLNSDLLGLMYHSYTKFNYKFMYHLATVWIETYTIDTNSCVTIIINDNNLEVISNKIRNKTIHKKQNS